MLPNIFGHPIDIEKKSFWGTLKKSRFAKMLSILGIFLLLDNLGRIIKVETSLW
jgi:hypothetical protein